MQRSRGYSPAMTRPSPTTGAWATADGSGRSPTDWAPRVTRNSRADRSWADAVPGLHEPDDAQQAGLLARPERGHVQTVRCRCVEVPQVDDAPARRSVGRDDGFDERLDVLRPAGAGVQHGAGIAASTKLFRDPIAEAAAVREDQPAPALRLPRRVGETHRRITLAIGGCHPPYK